MAISNDNTKVVTGSWDKTAIVWDINTGYKLLDLNGHKDFITSVAISNDNTKVVTSSRDNTAIIWNINTG